MSEQTRAPKSLQEETFLALKQLRDELANCDISTPFGSPLMYAFLKANALIARAEGGQS